jgi:hypothetical protein
VRGGALSRGSRQAGAPSQVTQGECLNQSRAYEGTQDLRWVMKMDLLCWSWCWAVAAVDHLSLVDGVLRAKLITSGLSPHHRALSHCG